MIGYLLLNFVIKKDNDNEPVLESTIEKFNYTCDSNATELYKTEFYKLKEMVETDINYEEYAKYISKLFIIDFYNLDNKITKDDVGGIQFIHPSIKDNFILKATDTIYKYVESNTDNNREQELPKVKEVIIDNITNETYKYGDKTDNNAYKIEISWTYEKDLGYQSKAVLMIVKEGEQLYIIEESE
jgi:hypothetical protein